MLFGISDLAIYSLYVIGLVSIAISIYHGLVLPVKESKFLGKIF